MSNTTAECRNCKGAGFTIEVRFASISHRRTERRWTCRYCKGTGSIAVDNRPTHEILAERRAAELAANGPAEIPEWMLG